MTILGATPVLDISITLLVIVFVVVSALIILVVMMQRPKQEGLGAAFGGGMTDQLLGAGTTSFLQKATVALGILFFLVALVLGILVGRSNKQQGLTAPTVVATEESVAPAIPAAGDAGNEDAAQDALLELLETKPEEEGTVTAESIEEAAQATEENPAEPVEKEATEAATPAEDAAEASTPQAPEAPAKSE